MRLARRRKANDTEDATDEKCCARYPPTNASEGAFRQVERGQIPEDEDDRNHEQSVEDLSADVEKASVVVATDRNDNHGRGNGDEDS